MYDTCICRGDEQDMRVSGVCWRGPFEGLTSEVTCPDLQEPEGASATSRLTSQNAKEG